MRIFTHLGRPAGVFLVVALFVVISPTVATAKTGLDLVPADSFGYIQVSDIYQIIEAVNESAEWEELSQIESAQTVLMQTNQIVPVVQMITGMMWDEFVKTFGHQITLVLFGISDNPDIGLIFDVQAEKRLAEDALDQFLILMSANEDFDATPESGEYAGVPFNSISVDNGNILHYGFLDQFMILALNDGFTPIVDVYQGEATPIAMAPEHQEMAAKVQPSGTAYAYVNLQRTIPALQAAEAAKKGEEIQPPEDEMEAALLKSPQALAVKLDLLGETQEAYLHLQPEGPTMIFASLLLREHPKLASVGLLPAINGAFIGLHIGDPTQTWTQLAGTATMLGHDIDRLMDGVEEQFKFYLKDDVLDALTGEVGIGVSLPQSPTAVKLKDNPIDIAKLQPVIAIGVKDRRKFEAIASIIAPLVQIDRFASSVEKSERIRRGIVTADALAPGVAIALWYTYVEELFIVSTSRAQVDAIVRQMEMLSPESVAEVSISPWVLGYVNLGQVAEFFVRQDLGDDIDLPEQATAKLPNISPIQIAYGAESDGVKLTLTTMPGQTWISNLLNALMVLAYAENPD